MNCPMKVAWNSNAASGKYNGYGNLYNLSEKAGFAEYRFEVSAAGDYVIYGRVLSKNSSDNSFFVSVIDGNYALWDTQLSDSWLWDQVNNRKNTDDPVVYYLEAGEHTFTIKQRVDETKIGKIMIPNDLKYVAG